MFLTLSDVLGWWVLWVFWIWWVWWVWRSVGSGGCGLLCSPTPLALDSGLVLRTPWDRPIGLYYMIWTTNTASHFYLIVWYQIVDGATRTFVPFCPYALLDLWERVMYLYLKKTDSGSRTFSFILNSSWRFSRSNYLAPPYYRALVEESGYSSHR